MASQDTSCLAGGGLSGQRLRTIDWSATRLGPVSEWPLSLQAATRIILNSDFPMMLHWGDDLITISNDAYAPRLGDKHPGHLGRPVQDWWSSMWDRLSPIFDHVLSGRSFHVQDELFAPVGAGGTESYYTHCHTPLWGDGGKVEGVFLVATETTRRVVAERRLEAASVQEHRKLEDDLRRLNETLEARVEERTAERDRLWALSEDLLVVADYRGQLIRVSPSWERVLGLTQDTLLDGRYTKFVHPDDLPAVADKLRHMIETGLPVRYEDRLQASDGSWRWISWIVSPEPDKKRVTGVGRDVTAEKERAESLKQAEEAMRQAQKMEAIGQLTGGVAHDFNNLLTVIRSSIDLLARPNLSQERHERYVEAISSTVDRAAKLTGQLLAFARRQALIPEVFDVGQSLRAIGEMTRTLSGSRIKIAILLPEEVSFVKADPSQFDTAIVNMAVNARDAMDGEGAITIEVERLSCRPAMRAHAAQPGEFLAIRISDTGIGIPPEHVDRIFEPFFTTKGVGQGTGLGLSQVFGFAKQSGGEIDVTSEPGHGTTFTLYLPRVSKAPSKPRPQAGPANLADGRGTRVLVVEDNADIGSFSTQTLHEIGFSTRLAADATTALTILETERDSFDVVFSDVVMPGMSGVDLAKEIGKRFSGLPVVLTSGYSHVLAKDGDHGFELVHKPYSVAELSRVLRKVVSAR